MPHSLAIHMHAYTHTHTHMHTHTHAHAHTHTHTHTHAHTHTHTHTHTGVGAATKGILTFMVGGEESSFNRAKPLLECMGKNVVHCGALVSTGGLSTPWVGSW